MDIVTTDIQTLTFIQGHDQFQQASKMGFWKNLLFRAFGRDIYLDDLNQIIDHQKVARTDDLGLQDIAISSINGSVDRSHDFTRDFAPASTNQEARDRWRTIYRLAVLGKGFPPVELYKVGDTYFVKDGHHRISVTAHLGWATIQAQVIDLVLEYATNELNRTKGVNLCAF